MEGHMKMNSAPALWIRSHAWLAIAWTIALGSMTGSVGCRMNQRVDLTPVIGEPVGGGLRIEWTAPAKGTAYLVERTTNRIMETRSLDVGETYSFSATSDVQRAEFERYLGIRLANARFLLYFRPAVPKPPAP